MFATMLVGLVLGSGDAPARVNESPIDWHINLVDNATHELKTVNLHQSGVADFKGLHCSAEIDGTDSNPPSTKIYLACSVTDAAGNKSTAYFDSGPCIWPTPKGFFPVVIFGALGVETASGKKQSFGITATCKAGEPGPKLTKPPQ